MAEENKTLLQKVSWVGVDIEPEIRDFIEFMEDFYGIEVETMTFLDKVTGNKLIIEND